MNDKLSFGKVFVLGFALFAMFFGAGNLIFPPALGIVTGTNWMISFLVYILADAGLAILALLAFFRCQEGFQNSISIQLDKTTSFLLILFNTLCIGPFIAIPRTAATTFDIAVKPLLGASFPGWTSWVAGGIYFGLVLILCLRPGKVVDIIGKVLSPTMFVALLVLIGIGIIRPLGKVAPGSSTMAAVKLGLESGYQTMDMLGALLFAVVTLSSVRQAGITSPKKQFRLVGLAGLVAAFALFVVYGGLTYLGASISGERGLAANALNDRAGLLVLIVRRLVGPAGTLLLGFIVTAACLTTSIGLASSCSQNIEELTHGKLPYRPVLIGMILFSYVMSNLGTPLQLRHVQPGHHRHFEHRGAHPERDLPRVHHAGDPLLPAQAHQSGDLQRPLRRPVRLHRHGADGDRRLRPVFEAVHDPAAPGLRRSRVADPFPDRRNHRRLRGRLRAPEASVLP